MTEAEFQQRYEQAACGLLSTTPTGTVIDVNATLLRWLGYRAPDLVGKPLTTVLDAGSQLFFETRHNQVLHLERKVSEVALTLKCADGSSLPVLMSSVLVDDGQGDVVRTAVFGATARLHYEAQLLHARKVAEASEERVRVLQEISGNFGGTATDSEVAASFVAIAREAFTATECAMHLRDETGALQLVAGVNPLDGAVAPIESLRNTTEFLILDADGAEADFPQLASAMRAERLEALSITPLINGSERLGLLTCFFARSRDFDDHFVDLQRALGRQVTQTLVRIRLQRRLEHLALHDQLTGAANRQLLQQSLDGAIEESMRTGSPLAVLFLDIDSFKGINDRLGHAAGDDVLRELAKRLLTGVRADDIVGRIGGDEFVVICADADLAAAGAIAERVLAVTRGPILAAGVPVSVSVSVGVATFRPDQDERPTGDQMLIRADGAMYASKDAGKDRVTFAAARDGVVQVS